MSNMKKTIAVLFSVALCLAWEAPSKAGWISVVSDPGTTTFVDGITRFDTTGAQMTGMAVTATFSTGFTQTAFWATTGSDSGNVIGTDWSITEAFTTRFNNWTVIHSRAGTLDRLVFDGIPGGTVFDRTFGGSDGTPNSASGQDFLPTLGHGPLDLLATYRDRIAVIGDPAVGDLYRFLDINLAATGNSGLASGSTLMYWADTDNTGVDDPPGVVPEPSSLALLGIGSVGLMLAGVRRRRKQTTA